MRRSLSTRTAMAAPVLNQRVVSECTEYVLAKRDNNVNIYMVDMCYISDGIYLTLGYYISWGEI